MIKQFILALLGYKDSGYFRAQSTRITESISIMKEELVRINQERSEYRSELNKKVREIEKELDLSFEDQEKTSQIIANIEKTFLV